MSTCFMWTVTDLHAFLEGQGLRRQNKLSDDFAPVILLIVIGRRSVMKNQQFKLVALQA